MLRTIRDRYDLLFLGAASIDEPLGFSGSPPVVITVYFKLCDYSGK